LPFSGEMDFVETSYVFPITHMVAPKNKALMCSEYHAKNGCLTNLTGFYMPGRDVNKVIQHLGWAVVFGSLVDVSFRLHQCITALLARFRKAIVVCLLNTIIESCKVTDRIHFQHLKHLQRRPR